MIELENPRDSHKSYFLLLIAVAIWCTLIIAAPILSHHQHNMSSGLIYFFFSKICHQIPDRSISILNNQFAVCSRCSGIYFGFLIGALIYPFLPGMGKMKIPDRKLLLFSAIPISLDICLDIAGLWHNTEFTRLFSGLLLGSVASWYAVPGFCTISWRDLFK